MNILVSMNIRKFHSLEDSIEQEYILYFQQLGYLPILVSNKSSLQSYFQRFNPLGVVFTGGIDLSNNLSDTTSINSIRDSFEINLLKMAIQEHIPILGICRGMQLINSFFGGTVSNKITGHVGTSHEVIFSESCLDIFNRKDKIIVNSFHNNGINPTDLSPSLIQLCYCSNDDLIEGVIHSNLPVLGFQWHPERDVSPNRKVSEVIKRFFK
jgi:putative glutamine amidotransferase